MAVSQHGKRSSPFGATASSDRLSSAGVCTPSPLGAARKGANEIRCPARDFEQASRIGSLSGCPTHARFSDVWEAANLVVSKLQFGSESVHRAEPVPGRGFGRAARPRKLNGLQRPPRVITGVPMSSAEKPTLFQKGRWSAWLVHALIRVCRGTRGRPGMKNCVSVVNDSRAYGAISNTTPHPPAQLPEPPPAVQGVVRADAVWCSRLRHRPGNHSPRSAVLFAAPTPRSRQTRIRA